jgi:hypothetical protein
MSGLAYIICVMKLRRCSFLFAAVCLLSACSLGDDAQGLYVFPITFDFNESQNGWSGGFADCKIEDEYNVGFQFSFDSLPSYVDHKRSLMISGTNEGENLFMFMKKKIGGLSPDTEYTLVYDVTFASNVPVGLPGADNVRLKVGATSFEPLKSEKDGYFRINIDKGTASQEGIDMVDIGTIGIPPGNASDYNLISRSNSASTTHPFFKARTNSHGEIWLIIGTDSSYKGTTKLYYSMVKVIFSVVE